MDRLTAGFACGFELCQTLKVWQRGIGSAKGSGTLPILAGLAKVNGPTRSIKKLKERLTAGLARGFELCQTLQV